MMKIGIVVGFAPPEFGAAVMRTLSFAKYFKERGNDAIIFAPDRAGKYRQYYEGIKIVRYRGFWHLLNIFRNHKLDIVVASTPPSTITFPSVLACKILGIPVIVDIRDPWSYAEASLGIVSTKIAYKKKYFIEKFSYKYADKLFVVSPYLRNMISSNFNISLQKFSIVMNGTELDKFRRVEDEGAKVRDALGIPQENPVIIYTGILGGKELDKFLESCGKEIVEKFDCHIIFAVILDRWSQPIAKDLRSIVEKSGFQENFHMVGPIHASEMYKYLSASDIGINPLPEGIDYCFPVKTFDYLACEIPIACKAPKDGALHRFMQEYDVGFFTDSWFDFKEKLLDVLDDLNAFKEKGIYGKKIVKEKFTREKANEIALKEIHKLLGGN